MDRGHDERAGHAVNKSRGKRFPRLRRRRENKLDAARAWFRGLSPAGQTQIMLRMLELQDAGEFGRIDAELIAAYDELKHTLR